MIVGKRLGGIGRVLVGMGGIPMLSGGCLVGGGALGMLTGMSKRRALWKKLLLSQTRVSVKIIHVLS